MTAKRAASGRLRRVLLTTDAVGGVWQYTLEVARACLAADIEPVLAVMGPPPDHDQRRQAQAIGDVPLLHLEAPLDWLATKPDELAAAGDRLLDVAADVAPDAVHLAGACHAAREWGVPVVATVHSCLLTWWAAMRREPPPDEWRAYGEAMARGLKRADAIIAPSAAYAQALKEVYGPLAKLYVVHNGREPKGYSPGIKQPFALAAGRFWDEAKNLAGLDAAAIRMQTRLYVAGPLVGPQGQEVAVSRAQALGPLTDGELCERMSQAAIFVSSSRFEPFGLAVLEAAYCKCALVLSDIPTFRELWSGAAIFMDPDDATGVAIAVDTLISAPEECKRLGARARRRAQRYTAERMGARTLQIYRDVLESSRPDDRRARVEG